MMLPGHGLVGGDWDLRGREGAYLGGVELNGRRVLEIGPASGFLTFHMEARGSEVVAVDLPEGSQWHMVPHARLDPDVVRAWEDTMRRMRRGFWLAHRLHASRARVVYADARALPDGLGRFDVGVMAAVLLHTRDPLAVLEQAARRSDRVVVTDLHVPELDGRPVQQLYPTLSEPQWHTWWRFSPDLFTQFLDVMGFTTDAVTFHEQTHLVGGQGYAMPMFTVVASRRQASGSAAMSAATSSANAVA
jgi:O-methyltransferase